MASLRKSEVIVLVSVFILAASIGIIAANGLYKNIDRNEVRAYKTYYHRVEEMLMYCKTDSVPKQLYDNYIQALTDVQDYEPLDY